MDKKMKLRIITKSEKETIEFAKEFVGEAMKGAGKDEPFDKIRARPLIFWLEGELGAGKTQFVKGIAQALGVKERITSPTFVLMKKFGIRKVPGKQYFFHIDAYRMYDAEDARQIGLDEIIKNPKAVVVIEWAERVKGIIPRPYWELKFEHKGEEIREIKMRYVKR